ncbi:hypothetical protein HanHA300_Chr11g0388161 [Helianthus annuus]|nr:hypothetical protein HanHA300_Chr11g0388161 [Helianthus annuus]KAJ0684171.1 hypothetical protein HanLR1_Chr11g0388241 [Helianthus annuus]KAJ0688127.1 hypothetical protein HanOQP8_Chr11g0390901 [Helianthus annuus]
MILFVQMYLNKNRRNSSSSFDQILGPNFFNSLFLISRLSLEFDSRLTLL